MTDEIIEDANFSPEMNERYEATEEDLAVELYNSLVEVCREERNKRLSETDWVHLPDVTISEELKQEYLTYRQALRDMTGTFETWYNAKSEEDRYHISNLSMPWPEKP